MKILLTGGGTGGHFYPLIAVAEAIREYAKSEKLIQPLLYYMAPEEYDAHALYVNEIKFIKVSAGKRRTYRSILNFFDVFKTGWGILNALIGVFSVYPDVVFSKGGYVSFPVLVAARFFRIPVIIHESDSAPGRTNLWASKFAVRIATSFSEAAQFFPQEKIAYTGNPVRTEILEPLRSGAHEFLKLNMNVPTILVLGGSQGSQIINEMLLGALPEILKTYQVIHQTGKNNYDEIQKTAKVVITDKSLVNRYKPFEYLNDLAMRMSAGAADIVVSRAGSTIFEIAAWGIPSIIIPITNSNGDHQRKNAFNYSRTGAAVVIEEINLSPNILTSEIERLMSNPAERQKMADAAKKFSKPDAAGKIAEEVLRIALTHER